MAESADQNIENVSLESGSYEIIRDRLNTQAQDLRNRLQQLNEARKEVFGAVETKLLTTERVTTENNCFARDIIGLGDNRFIFGYNVRMGLKTETAVADVFSVYQFDEQSHSFSAGDDTLFKNPEFQQDFINLYKYYRDTRFAKFARIGSHIFMIFQVGKTPDDIKTFKFSTNAKGDWVYVDNRSDHEFSFPNQHEFRWKKALRDMHRKGKFPHISIEDKVFVETVGSDLTIKVEDNTDTGKGIFEEPVEHKDQTLDDAEIYYALVGNLILLKIRPYQEKSYRYIVFNQKMQQAVRIDALEDSCVLLPDDQGIIFSKGYYSQTGEVKLFDNQLNNMLFEKRVASPNGEDYLYIFYQKEHGLYALMPYNIISQEVDTPIVCNGYSFFDNGELIFFKGEEEQRKHHLIQIWQTPFHSPNKTVEVANKSYLFKLGNREIVQAMAEAGEVLKLLRKEDNYANLYIDLVKVTNGILDSYHWLNHAEAFGLNQPIAKIKEAAAQAIAAYEKVLSIKKNTAERFAEVSDFATEAMHQAKRGAAKTIYEFVERLTKLRTAKGQMLSLKELRYIDLEQVAEFESQLASVTDEVSKSTIAFLLKKEALAPYREKVAGLDEAVEKLEKAAEATRMQQEVGKLAGDLEMLIEIVSNLKIEDATQTTSIIDSISAIYANFNRINAALRKKRKALLSAEGEAEFNAQLKLAAQALTNYFDVADTPEKCEDYRNKLMVQLEELEGRFADFEMFITRIADTREDVYNAFESKKVQLNEARQKRTLALQQSGERLIAGIAKRLLHFETLAEINAYFAADLMVDKARNVIAQLLELNDSVKADDLDSRLKTAYEEATRQLSDKKELFVEGKNVIKFGAHQFNVNTQEVDLTIVNRQDALYFHITGTNYFEQIVSPEIEATRTVWSQTLISETPKIYRAAFLAHQLFVEAENQSKQAKPTAETLEELQKSTPKALLGYVQRGMATRYDQGYVKGVHDKDAAAILGSLVQFYHTIGLLRYNAKARVLAHLFWVECVAESQKELWMQEFANLQALHKVFSAGNQMDSLVERLAQEIQTAGANILWADPATQRQAANYLLQQQLGQHEEHFTLAAWQLADQFAIHLKKQNHLRFFEQTMKTATGGLLGQLGQAVAWLQAFAETQGTTTDFGTQLEAAIILLTKQKSPKTAHKISVQTEITGLLGDHPQIQNGAFWLHYNHFMQQMADYMAHEAAAFVRFAELKKEVLHREKSALRLSSFKPKVMSAFVRNKLINEVYLPLIGDNLAKQIGAAGSKKRTDLMGLLLLISPPGYGKTTLMEYVANRLGLVFMKINGPAIGHSVTHLDPTTAGHSAAREELEKLNLAFEMGDNVMIYLDDIQHCNPELLQKFISLTDAQRKIEGVYKGVSKTYDLRGRKVAVVMAGNPYTESGEVFKIPDMLANRADTYNLGDIIGDKRAAFELSYLENSLTSNPIMAALHGKSQRDFYTLVQMAQTGSREAADFEAGYSAEEINDYVNLLQKMLVVQDAILKVNQQYIKSAGQADAYRTEPPFLLQGSYRNMNKIVEKLNPLQNEAEVASLLLSHYQNESQTLTGGAEYNLLKFKELFGVITADEAERKAEIVTTFAQHQKLSAFGGNQMGAILAEIDRIARGLQAIGEAIKER